MTKTAIALNVSLLVLGLLLLPAHSPPNSIKLFGMFIIVYAAVYLLLGYRSALRHHWQRTWLYTHFERKTPAQRKRTIAVLLIAQMLLLVLLWTGVVVQIKAMRFDPPRRPVPVVVAAADLRAQTRLTAKQVEVVKMSDHGFPRNYLTSGTHVVGAKLKASIAKGQALTADMITREMTAVDVLRPGMRAFSLSFSRDDDSVGFVQSGSIVDLHVTLPSEDEEIGEALVIAPLLQQLRVIAVDGETAFTQGKSDAAAHRMSSENTEIVLEVTDKQAGVLQLAQEGRLALALRHPMDTKFYPVQPMVLKQGRIEPFGDPLDPQDPTARLDLMRMAPTQPAPEPVQDAADPRGEKK